MIILYEIILSEIRDKGNFKKLHANATIRTVGRKLLLSI